MLFLLILTQSAPMDVVSCHISNDVNNHQCRQNSYCLRYNSNFAGADSVVDPVWEREAEQIETGYCSLYFNFIAIFLFHYCFCWFQQFEIFTEIVIHSIKINVSWNENKENYYKNFIIFCQIVLYLYSYCILQIYQIVRFGSHYVPRPIFSYFEYTKYTKTPKLLWAAISTHLVKVGCDASTFMLILSSFQRSYCTLPTLLESICSLSEVCWRS